MYSLASFAITLAAAIYAGIKFATTATILKNGADDDRDFALPLGSALLACAFPFYVTIPDKLGSTVSMFMAVCAVSTWATIRFSKG